jgi:hypothetical protein
MAPAISPRVLWPGSISARSRRSSPCGGRDEKTPACLRDRVGPPDSSRFTWRCILCRILSGWPRITPRLIPKRNKNNT